MKKVKDCLVIVHASDRWLDDNLEPSEIRLLKNAILKRVELYIQNKKPVFYTPFIGNDRSIPKYLPAYHRLKSIGIDSDKSVPGLNLLKFQAIIILRRMMENRLSSLELCGVRENACVKGTKNAIHNISENDLMSYSGFSGEDLEILKFSTLRKIDVLINNEATDYILWGKKK